MAISMVELGWAAGFLEGEGSFTAVSAGRRADGRPRASFNVSVNAGQVNLEPLHRLQKLFGGHIYRHNMHTGNPIWRWQIYGKAAIGIMLTVWTMMSERRRQQIENAVTKWKGAAPVGNPIGHVCTPKKAA